MERSIIVEIAAGLQARPAAHFVRVANRFTSDIFLEKDNKKINGKSIMGLMSLAIATGERVTLFIDGDDQELAMEELVAFISNK